MLSTRPRSVTPHRRWRSARRRSNEKSAAQIRREVAPFWRTKTGAQRLAAGYLINRVEEGWEVVVNGRRVALPHPVDDSDHVTLVRHAAPTAPAITPATTATTTAVARFTPPPPWLQKDARVDVYAVLAEHPRHLDLGTAPILRNRRCLCDPFPMNAQWGILVDGKRGWIPIESLRQSE